MLDVATRPLANRAQVLEFLGRVLSWRRLQQPIKTLLRDKRPHLIGEHRHCELARQERVQHFADDLPVGATRNVRLETDVRKLRLGRDMDRHITALGKLFQN
ncbi:hypothetical protein TcasGA2_TC006525 [Tribolium castaneum]|uniref:Uncharacterized protein n=1 Tax=Tribolium castaneum TaxID=7070 RepID=D6WXE0_TRICA|nr:hypothetical protein TcasGA2_TC006525 [Tribolium castaneum]